MTAPIAPPAPTGLQELQSRLQAIRSLVSPGASFASVLGAATTSTAPTTSAGLDVGIASASPAGSVDGQDVVDLAASFAGTPYVWGGADPETGFDCSGLVQHVYARFGIDLPRVSSEQARAGTPVASLAEALPGDLVAFGEPVDHIGIYAGEGRMVVAPHRGDVVKVQPISTTPAAIRRVLPDAAIAPASPFTGTGDYDALFAAAGERYGVAPSLLASVAKTESGMRPDARSSAGALGLMQLMPATAKALGVDPLDPAQAVDGAARLLAGQLKRFGSTELALAAYNAGGPAVARHGGIPPFPETQAYVRRVMAGVAA